MATKRTGKTTGNNNQGLQIKKDMTIYNVTELRDELIKHEETCPELLLNLAGVTEIDTAGIQLLLTFRQKAATNDQIFKIVDASEAVKNTFHILGMASLIEQNPKLALVA